MLVKSIRPFPFIAGTCLITIGASVWSVQREERAEFGGGTVPPLAERMPAMARSGDAEVKTAPVSAREEREEIRSKPELSTSLPKPANSRGDIATVAPSVAKPKSLPARSANSPAVANAALGGAQLVEPDLSPLTNRSNHPITASTGVPLPLVVAVNGNAPGSALAVGQQRVTVVGRTTAPTDPEAELIVSISEDTPVNGATTSRESSSQPIGSSLDTIAGFTHEEALFRMRWGWAAADRVKRAALEGTAAISR